MSALCFLRDLLRVLGSDDQSERVALVLLGWFFALITGIVLLYKNAQGRRGG